ncbi:hypothetical protein A1F94_006932 [Pyrenophora tritici-repentis]|uniref:Uncharacterized protein n=1 Tax=Pyrenophora tritici-repentis TaxID=45151 RepID=A0A2W1EPJ6_9PLEO|nr:hypothetical protein A1F94_006932 [Pyrenophora tritici-repentis]KAI1510991.1 hypothetical protein Ptr86124_010112 [Pyrenophora tritici-repentis]KAI1668273.1 hypothetical protein L13192_07409 [Pyrenophora tritici-repentis]KAI1680998.1 hypothetical protein KJE20_09849 [Pyrenophora tritici-repentis]PZC91027.1 hypothetical protein A1F95_09070 [Pyrenophora tritici-repentis]
MSTYGTFHADPEPEQHPVRRAKAPWNLMAECYTLLLKLKDLPKGVYDPLEAAWADKGMGEFVGGLGAVIIVRYSDTPVGPYDELMIVPGSFTVPHPADGPLKIPKKALRISRIYVSQRTTTYNGRLNWNIPKNLARFSFSAPPTVQGQTPPKSLTVQVFPPGTTDGDGEAPFFACTLKPWQWIPAIPVNTKYMPISLTVAQPPIREHPGHKAAAKAAIEGPPVDEYDLDPKKAEAVLVGTDRWRAVDCSSSAPRARGCWVEVHENETKEQDDGEKTWFPKNLGTWAVGGWLEELFIITALIISFATSSLLVFFATTSLIISLITTSILISFIMVSPPPQCTVPWTMTLLRRDIRNLRTKSTAKLKNTFAFSRTATDASMHPEVESDSTTAIPGGRQDCSEVTETASEGSVSTKPVQDSHSVAEVGAKKGGNALYELLQNKLKASYASRVLKASHEARWSFRGSWLLLYMATQACPSNDSYNIFRGDQGPPDESQMLLDLLQQSIEPTQSTTAKVSMMPADPYTEDNNIHTRYDSMFSDAGKSIPSPVQIWLTILQAANDSTKIEGLAEELLGYVYPGKNATDILDQIGNPSRKLNDDDDALLRARLQMLLYPGYEALTSNCI